MLKKLRRFAAPLFAVMLVFSQTAYPAGRDARTISILRIDGANIAMTKGTSKEYAPKEKFKLSDGYTLTTGKNTFCYLQLDESTVVKLDQNTKISISKKSKNKLSITVVNGSALMDAGKREDGDTLETRVGNIGLTVRGTLYTMGKDPKSGQAVITMLDGSGDVNGTTLSAGYKLTAIESKATSSIITSTSVINLRQIDLLTALAMWEYQYMLIRNGLLTADLVKLLPDIIQELAAAVSAENNKQAPKIDDIIIFENAGPTPRPAPTQGPSSGINPVPTPEISRPTATPYPTSASADSPTATSGPTPTLPPSPTYDDSGSPPTGSP